MKKGTFHPKRMNKQSFLLLLVAAMNHHHSSVAALAAPCDSALGRDATSDETSLCRLPSPKSTSVATKAATNGFTKFGKTRMNTQPSLAEKMASLSDSKEFVNRLQLEEERFDRMDRATVITVESSFDKNKIWIVAAAGATTMVAAVCVLFVLPTVFPAIADNMALSTASSVLALLPWNYFSKKTSMLIMDVMALIQLLSREQVQEYLRDKVLPSAWSTLHKMLIMEFWRRVWKFVGLQLSKMYNNNTKDSDDWRDSLPSWVTKPFDFCKGVVQRGTYKLMQRSVQKRVHEALVEATEVVLKYVESAMQQFLQAPQPVATIAASA